MPITQYPDIDALLGELRDRHQALLGAKLAGLYLYGSLVWGDFDHDSSDIDMLAALTAEVDDDELGALERLHADFIAAHPYWRNRVEVAYVTLEALRTFREQTSTIAVISPGEPLHHKAAGRDWLMNWYISRYSVFARCAKTEYEKMKYLAAAGSNADCTSHPLS